VFHHVVLTILEKKTSHHLVCHVDEHVLQAWARVKIIWILSDSFLHSRYPFNFASDPMSSDAIPALLQSIHASPRKARKGNKYSLEEIKILTEHRDEYKATINHDKRRTLLHQSILPDIFTYWHQRDKVLLTPDEARKKVKEICDWIRNNWRIAPGMMKASPAQTRKQSRIEVVWRQRHSEVMDEIKVVHEEEGYDGEPEVFRCWQRAAKRVYGRLSDDEKAAIDDAINRYEVVPNPPEIKQK
jgi:hypothetical protein